ncbi:hypothetical protein [Coleofasciculus sp.]|uniref:hypothetical protein n=1 Tax=Coleofasciculus sp. TaxID=3100458 RepID=UPI003A11B48B
MPETGLATQELNMTIEPLAGTYFQVRVIEWGKNLFTIFCTSQIDLQFNQHRRAF